MIRTGRYIVPGIGKLRLKCFWKRASSSDGNFFNIFKGLTLKTFFLTRLLISPLFQQTIFIYIHPCMWIDVLSKYFLLTSYLLLTKMVPPAFLHPSSLNHGQPSKKLMLIWSLVFWGQNYNSTKVRICDYNLVYDRIYFF